MGLLEGWFSAVSKEEKERRKFELQQRVFPFGEDAQKEYAVQLLGQLFKDTKIHPQEALLGYVAAKNEYVLCGKGENGALKATKHLKRLGWKGGILTAKLLAFIEIETDIEYLEDYPTVEDVERKLKEVH